MFGYNKAKRERRNIRKERQSFNKEKSDYANQEPQREMQSQEMRKNEINRGAQESELARNASRQKGRAYAKDVFSQNVEGLTPERRKAMQFEANQRIRSDANTAQRKLLGNRARKNIGGNSGIAFAQNQELERMANEARSRSQQDINSIDADLMLKKLAAGFNVEQGEAVQGQLDRQLSADEYDFGLEKKRQRALEDQARKSYNSFSRI